jgi:restriction system protein
MWMVRAGRRAAWVEDFLDGGLVAIGWNGASELPLGSERADVQAKTAQVLGHLRTQQISAAAGQIYRFLTEMRVGDWVCTYDPGLRRYCLGTLEDDDGVRDHGLSR